MESFAWVVFLFFTWHQCLIIVLFVVRIQYDVCLIIVVLFYCSTMHSVMLLDSDSSHISSLPSFCAMAVKFSCSPRVHSA